VEKATVADLERIYRERFGAFVRVAHGITRDRESAVDAVQETFASALQHRRSYRGEGSLEAWLWRSLVNNALQNKPRPSLALVPSDAAAPPADPSWLVDPIRRLPERQRIALFLRYYADLDYRTIASLLEIEIGTVSATLSAARTQMRSAIEEAR
jgi:RNA polymerase sigma factor (sigma-70 family)